MGWQDAPLVEAKGGWQSAPIVGEDAPAEKPSFGKMLRQEVSDSLPGAVLRSVPNIPASAGKMVSGLADAVMNPIDTAAGLGDAVIGGIYNLTGSTPKTEADRRSVATADAVGQALKGRYGSIDALKKTVETDPVGAVADLSTVLGGGASVLPKASKASQLLRAGAEATNPLNAVKPILKGAGTAIDKTVSPILGAYAGVGAENLREAAKAGFRGKKAFFDNLTGKADFGEVVGQAQQGLEKMRVEKSAQYRSGMVNIKADKSVLNFAGIDKAIADADGVVKFKGQVKNSKAAAAVREMADEVAEWKKLDPAEFHTPEGMDALKQKLGGILETIPYEQDTARKVAGAIYGSVKGEISKQAPTYSKVMKDYSEASELVREIERALSLGPKGKFAADTAIRKLQSLGRNNVNTNYGSRLKLMQELEQKGGVDLMPAIAGQSMNSLMPRGLTGRFGAGMAGYAAMQGNPLAMAAIPFSSPAILGATAYGAGKLAGLPGRLPQPMRGLLGDLTPSANQGLLMYQAGQVPSQ